MDKDVLEMLATALLKARKTNLAAGGAESQMGASGFVTIGPNGATPGLAPKGMFAANTGNEPAPVLDLPKFRRFGQPPER